MPGSLPELVEAVAYNQRDDAESGGRTSPHRWGRRAALLLAGILLQATTAGPGTAQDEPPEEAPRAGWEDGSFFLESADGTYRLTLGGRIQPRYELVDPTDAEETSSFFLRRVRLDVQGHLMDERLTFRFMPELAGEVSLRDAWLNYAFDPRLELRAGQLVVPFHWHRAISGNRQHFAERSRPSETFGFPRGYDAGVAVHGRNRANTLHYGVGLFDGAGRNVRDSDSSGHMASARGAWAITGTVPQEEPDLAHSAEFGTNVGLGLQGAVRNEARAWDLGRSDAANPRADFGAVTGDVSVRWRGFSAFAEGYLRRVHPDASGVDAYTGNAHTLGTGFFVVPRRFEVVPRRSDLRLDRDAPLTRERQWGLGLNAYPADHSWKTHGQILRTSEAARSRTVGPVQIHLQF